MSVTDLLHKAHRRGFTTIEVILATFAFAVLTTAVIGIAALGTRTAVVSEQRTVAQGIANERAEVVYLTPFNDVGTIGGDPDGIFPAQDTIDRNGQTYTVDIAVELVDDPENGNVTPPLTEDNADYKEVFVTVTPPGAGSSQQDVQVGVVVTRQVTGSVCSETADCGVQGGESCCGGQCIISCKDDTWCPLGWQCAEDGCGCEPAECVDDLDCAPGLSCCGDGCVPTCDPSDCGSGTCAADGCGCEPEDSCSTDDDCGAGRSCCAEGCIPSCQPTDCPSDGWQCAEDGCGCERIDSPICLDNNDCPPGFNCCDDGGACTEACQPSDCDPGYTCSSDGCGCEPAGGPCTGDAQCVAGDSCCDGACIGACVAGDCPAGYGCSANGCGCEPLRPSPSLTPDGTPTPTPTPTPNVTPTPSPTVTVEPPVDGECPGPIIGECIFGVRIITYFIDTGDSCIPLPVPVFCGGGPEPPDPPTPEGDPPLICCQDECTSDEQCPADVKGPCRFNPQQGNECGRSIGTSQCSPDQVIKQCRMLEGEDPIAACGPGDVCPGDLQCIGGNCVCTSTADCPAGQRCNENGDCIGNTPIDPNDPLHCACQGGWSGGACGVGVCNGLLCCPIPCPPVQPGQMFSYCPNGEKCTEGVDICPANPKCTNGWAGRGTACENDVVWVSPGGCEVVAGVCQEGGPACPGAGCPGFDFPPGP